MNLALTPRPFPDESLIGYLVRLASTNGYRYIRRIFKENIINAAVRYNVEVVNIALALELSIARPAVKATSVLWESPILLQARVCPKCIEELGYIKSEVQNPYITHCSTHGDELIDTCPACKQQLNWDINLINGRCSECALKLSIAPTTLPRLSQAEVSDCLFALAMMGANEKPYFHTPKYCSINHMSESVILGAQLLTDERMFKSWVLKTLRKQDPLAPRYLRLIDVDHLFTWLRGIWPVQNIREDIYKICYFSGMHSKDSSQIPAKLAAGLLRITLRKLTTLTDLKIIKNAGKSKIHARSRIDIRPLLWALRLYTPTTGMVPLVNQIKLLERYDIDLGDLLIARDRGEIRLGYRPDMCFFTSLFCNPHDLVSFAERMLYHRSITNEVVSLETAMKLTQLSKEELYCQRQKGRLPLPNHYRNRRDSMFYITDLVKCASFKDNS